MTTSLKRNAAGALIRNAVTGALCSTCCGGGFYIEIDGVRRIGYGAVPDGYRYDFGSGDYWWDDNYLYIAIACVVSGSHLVWSNWYRKPYTGDPMSYYTWIGVYLPYPELHEGSPESVVYGIVGHPFYNQ